MNELTILLNTEHPSYSELSRSVAETLDAFNSIAYKIEKKSAEPGTLAVGLHEVVAYAVTHREMDESVILKTPVRAPAER